MKINGLYQESIKGLEDVIESKDQIIADHLSSIRKLTEGGSQELKDIQMMFFSKNQDLLDTIVKQRTEFHAHTDKFKHELKARDIVEKNLK